MDNRISLPTWDLGNLEAAMPSRVTRFEPTEADRALGWPGALESVDGSWFNYGRRPVAWISTRRIVCS